MQRSGPSTGQGLGTQLQGTSLRLWRGFEKPSLGPSQGKAVHPKTHPQRQWRVLIRLFGLLSSALHTLSLLLKSRKGTMVYTNPHPVRDCVGSSPPKNAAPNCLGGAGEDPQMSLFLAPLLDTQHFPDLLP